MCIELHCKLVPHKNILLWREGEGQTRLTFCETKYKHNTVLVFTVSIETVDARSHTSFSSTLAIVLYGMEVQCNLMRQIRKRHLVSRIFFFHARNHACKKCTTDITKTIYTCPILEAIFIWFCWFSP